MDLYYAPMTNSEFEGLMNFDDFNNGIIRDNTQTSENVDTKSTDESNAPSATAESNDLPDDNTTGTTGNTGTHGLPAQKPMPAQQSMGTITPPAPVHVWTAPSVPATTLNPQLLQATPPAVVVASNVTPAAPQAAAINKNPASILQCQTPISTGTPSKKGEAGKAKKQKHAPVNGSNYSRQITALGADHSYGLGIMQPQQLAIAQPMPQGYQASTNPAHAHLFQLPQVQRFTPPQVNMGFGSPPFMPVQNTSLSSSQQQAQYFNAPMTTQQQSLSLSQQYQPSLVQAANTPVQQQQEETVEETDSEDVYTVAAQAKMDSLMSGPQQQDEELEDLPDLPDLAAHVEHARQLFIKSTPKHLAEFLGSSPEKQTKMIANAAASAYAHQMFENQSAENIPFFLSSSPEMKMQTMKNTAGFDPPMQNMKRKRAVSVIDGATLYSPFTETFLTGLQGAESVFDQQNEQEYARLEWEAADTKREYEQHVALTNVMNLAMHISQDQPIIAEGDTTTVQEVAPETPGFAFGEDDSSLPGFEDDVEPADELHKEADAVELLGSTTVEPITTEVSTVAATEAADEELTVPASSITTNTFQGGSDEDMSSLFGDDEEEIAAPSTVTFGGIPRSSLPTMPVPPVYDGANAITAEDEAFAKMLNEGGPSNFTDESANLSGFDMGNFLNMPLSDYELEVFGQTSTFDGARPMNDLENPDIYNEDTNVYDGYALMDDEGQNHEMIDETDQSMTEVGSTYASPPAQQDNYMPAPSLAPIQAQAEYSAPQQHYAPPQQYASPEKYNSNAQALQTTQVAVDNDDTEDGLDNALNTFVTQAIGMVAPPPMQQQLYYSTTVQPALTAAGPEDPLCPLFLASNGTNCPYGPACNDRHYYISGPGISLTQAIGTQINYMSAHAIQDQDMVQEGLMVTKFKRGARLVCKNCGQQKPVSNKNDGVRCTPCFKRWCNGKD